MSSEGWDDVPPQSAEAVVTATPGRVWSEEQIKIGEWAKGSKGNAKVVARAGCGKTSSIAGVVIPNAPEAKILYVVFNKKNQLEAKDKISDPRVDVKTFNGLGFGFVRGQWRNCRPDDLVERDRIRLIEPKIPNSVIGEVLKLVGWAKNCSAEAKAAELEMVAEEKGWEAEEWESREWGIKRLAEIAKAAMDLAKEPEALGRISFNDQLWLPIVMGWVRPWWDLVIVDEAQDTNPTQKKMIEGCFRKGGRILFVGDNRQAIYGFRGADGDSLGQLGRRFSAETLTLTTTYRCAKAIVREANVEVPDLKARDGAPEGMVNELTKRALIGVVGAGDAILSRTNAPLMPICLALLKAGKRAKIEGREIGKQLLAIAEKWKARTVPEFLTGVTAWKQRKVARVLAKNLDPDIAAGQLEGIEDQASIFFAVAEDAEGVAEINQRLLTLFGEAAGDAGGIVLSSVHRAKGLEWKRVFLLGETFRREKGGEEANIWYVATTRAQQSLTWVW